MLSTHYAYLGVSISSKALGLNIREQSQITDLATDTRKPHPLRTIDGARKILRSVMRNPLSFYMAPGGWASSHSIKRSIPRNSLWLPHEFKYHFPRPSCSEVLLDGCTFAT